MTDFYETVMELRRAKSEYDTPESRKRFRDAIETVKSNWAQAQSALGEATLLLRQIYYARSYIGTKFCDELDKWKLEDLQERILRCIGDLK
jgi:hypothetical protein